MLATIDLAIICVYGVFLLAAAYWVSREQDGRDKNTQDYFLASQALPWWAVGASLVAANISAEQIIGMSGSGYVIGLAIASYEWMAAITLILVGKFLLPIFLANNIRTMPQFLEQRFDGRVRLVLAVFWLAVYVFVNLTAILWLGALTIHTVTGLEINLGLVLIGTFAIAYSLYGGLKAVAFTDILQVVLLVAGGLMVSWILLDAIAEGAGPWAGWLGLLAAAPEKFDMILAADHPQYMSLPGLSVLIGGMWIMNLSYWGFNQYIIQRALAAKSLDEAQKGIVFAAFLKLLMPLIVVLPGIAMFVLNADLTQPDQAYPTAMTMLPAGIKGLVFAALIAAILSSLASMANSISTIFTLDLYSAMVPARDQRHLVRVGRAVAVVAMLLAMICARPLLGNFDQAFQYIQEFTGFFTPGIVAIFLLGMFWPRTTANAALAAALGSAILSFALKLGWPALPFIDRVGWVFVACVMLAVLVSLRRSMPQADEAIDLSGIRFETSRSFNLAAIAVSLILTGLYITWW
ncbi:MAG: sodium/sugar symporter [Pseudomonadales bacterium]|jgi:SSS family solute:Na+ symporter|nr:sodium/sugar symporter [Pseudomonadales bacterium]MDA0760843.1 sodium/sugar symporter [Pseudomonadota bacterium]MDA0956758.1 sodium/sugar symporter [Pseudomonadota bacterium]MDA1207912.1 sodium/sugar symporter [Pseudomonadota bacterium]